MGTLNLLIEFTTGECFNHQLGEGVHVVGRDKDCDLTLASPEVYRRHLQITFDGLHCQLLALENPANTLVKGEPLVDSVTPKLPTEVTLGGVIMTLFAVEEEDALQTIVDNASDDVTSVAAFTNGNTSGHYTPGRQIAQGGMGAILEADDQFLGRTVAMKIIRHDMGDTENIRLRFVREALVLARLEHPNIVPIHEMGKDAHGHLFYTMKKVEGCTLQAVIDGLKNGDSQALQDHPLDALLNIFRKVCDAMAFAHSKGVIHRDLKPENIMTGAFGEVLVMDWGLAKILFDADDTAQEIEQLMGAGSATETSSTDGPHGFGATDESAFSGSSPELTLVGAVMGSPQYMPPEQAEGRITDLDERSDIFSLGCILYAILTLRHPVGGSSVAEVLENVKTGRIAPPTHYNTGKSSPGDPDRSPKDMQDTQVGAGLPHCPGGRVPTALSAVCMKALALRRADRYQSVADFAKDIEQWQGGFATSAESVGFIGQLGLLVKRHKAVSIASLVAAAVLILVSVIFVTRLNLSKDAAIVAKQDAIEQRDEAERLQKETRKALAQSSISLAETALRDADSAGIQTSLAKVPEDLRGSTWRYLMHQSDSSIARLETSTGNLEGVAADPTRLGVFAVVDENHMVTVIDVRSQEQLLEFEVGFKEVPNGGQRRVAFSPDGRLIAVGWNGVGGVAIHDARTGVKLRQLGSSQTRHLEFGKEGSLLQVKPHKLWIWNPSNGKLLWTMTREEHGGPLFGTFTPDGLHVVTHTNKLGVQLRDATDGSVVKKMQSRNGVYHWIGAIHPHGDLMYTWTESNITECVSMADGKRLFALPDKEIRNLMAFTADGLRLITVAKRNDGGQLIQVWNAKTGALLRSILGGSGDPMGVSIHPLSHELVITGSETRVWDLRGPPERWEFAVSEIEYTSKLSFWGSDNLVLGTLPPSNKWGLYQLGGTKTSPHWQPDGPAKMVTAISPDGRVAALSKPGFSGKADILRRDGLEVTLTGSHDVGFWPYRLRINGSGSRLALMERPDVGASFRKGNPQNRGLAVIDTDSGQIAFKPQIERAQRLNDVGWLAGGRLAGLVTTGTMRGNPGSVERLLVWSGDGILNSTTHKTAMDAMAISPDGKRLAEAGADRNIRIRDAESLEVLTEFRVHEDGITSIAWHPKLQVIATSSKDLSVKLWDLESIECIEEFRGMVSPPKDLIFSPSGTRLAAAYNEQQKGRIWELDPVTSKSVWSWKSARFKHPQFTPEEIIGRYSQDDPQNNWNSGEIRAVPGKPGELEWLNDAGKVWGLNLGANTKLVTDHRNLYRNQYANFNLVISDSEEPIVLGFKFQGKLFRRQK
ncbi:MAG: protein kinase [Akkermansiaceae bacterium]